MTLHAVTALVDRRREIMRERAFLEQELRLCDQALEHLGAAIKLLDPGFNLGSLEPKRLVTEDELFHPGEAPLLALDVLRQAGRPMSTTDITRGMLAIRELSNLPAARFETLNRKVNACLNTKVRQGVVRKAGRVQGANRAILWELV
ncbi:MAG TPA: hypothetical protein VED40_23010 [Azospirillaceae bacterium]|nr:hypothetical protein [Azospirillaceae bacterium]